MLAKKTFLFMIFISLFLMIVSCSDSKESSKEVSDDEILNDIDDEEWDDPDDEQASFRFGKVVLDPSGNAPLTAEIEFYAETAGKIEVNIESLDNETDFTYSFDIEEKGTYGIPVLGLYPGHENNVSFVFYDNSDAEIESYSTVITTAPLPEDFPSATATGYYEGDEFTFTVYTRTRMEEDLEGIYGGGLVSYLANITGIAFDKWGNIRWYSNFPEDYLFPMEIINNEIVGSDWINAFEHIYAYDFMGNGYEKIHLTPTGFIGVHHDIIKTIEENYLITSDKIGSFILEDHIIEVASETHELLRVWDLKETIPEIPDLLPDVPISGDPDFIFSNDPIHVNAVWHDENDDSIIITMQRGGTAKIASDGTLKWFLTPHIIKYLDDEDGNNISDSLEDGYDVNDRSTWIGNFRGEDGMSLNENYIHHRMPIAGKPEDGVYPFDFHYGHFLLKPLDASGNEITEEKYTMGFADHDEFRWPFRPHTPVILENGNIMLFDNGLTRNFEASPDFSRAVEYEIIEDESGYGGTARQVWEYIVKEDEPLQGWSIVVSSVYELQNGNRVVTSGSIASSILPDFFFAIYGDGPIGAYIVEVDPVTNEEPHSLLIERYIDETFPNSAFSVYRSKRVNITEGIKPYKK